jgi:hypothetical protein
VRKVRLSSTLVISDLVSRNDDLSNTANFPFLKILQNSG